MFYPLGKELREKIDKEASALTKAFKKGEITPGDVKKFYGRLEGAYPYLRFFYEQRKAMASNNQGGK